jgi:TBC1 domain family member 5
VERDAAQLREVQRTLGASVSWIVDTLLLDEDDDKSEERVKKVKESKREALEALAYVRDVLLSGSTDVDEERLMSEEDFKKRRKAQQEKQEQEGPTSSFNKAIISLPPASRPAAPIQAVNAPRPRAVASHSALLSSPSSSFDTPRPGAPMASSKAPAFVVTSNTQEAKPLQAPWNYTRSNFSSSIGFSAEVPSLAPLPRASTTLAPPAVTVQNTPSPSTQTPPSSRLHDPLGALL